MGKLYTTARGLIRVTLLDYRCVELNVHEIYTTACMIDQL
jgi:hypothetical protein